MDEYEKALNEFFRVYNGLKKIYIMSLQINFKPQDQDIKFSLEVIRTQGKNRKIILKVKEDSDTEAFKKAHEELLRYYKLRKGEQDGTGQKKRDMVAEWSNHGGVN